MNAGKGKGVNQISTVAKDCQPAGVYKQVGLEWSKIAKLLTT